MKSALIIDDDADYRALIAEVLQADGWQVWDADTGERGVDLAREHRPHVVICDLLMPRGNGFHVCRTLRAEPQFRSTRIIVTTGRAYKSDHQNAIEAGANEYLIKPFELPALVKMMNNLAGSAAISTVGQPGTAEPQGEWLKF